MASHAPDHDHDADEVMRRAAERGLGSRHRLRLGAIALWSSFLGAVLMVLVALAVLPEAAELDLAGLSVAFFCAWALTLVPVTLALMLERRAERP